MRVGFKAMVSTLATLLFCMVFVTPGLAAEPASDFASVAKSAELKQGFFDLYIDEDEGRILARLPKPDADGMSLRFIYATGITAGLGSNPIGLDRGAFDSGVIVRFRRIGKTLIAEQENLNYRASAQNELERRAVAQSFAPSFLWSGEIMDTDGQGRLLVDLSSFVTRDHFGIASQIKSNPKGGSYSLESSRSIPDPSAALAFPDNVELDAFLTFTSNDPGAEPSATAADARSVTLMQHHSFVRLPKPGFTPRRYDPRTAAIEVAYYDFSAPLDQPIIQRFARRYRLEKINPELASSPVKEPIIFYVDPGAPAQVRDALIEGAMWWADAFEAAGFEDAYRVEVLPEDAHPFDIRYNMIQWVHRQTRGWSYGGGVSDPRTGEMLKANVILGSQRVRQDRMIFEGLAGAVKTGTGDADDPVEIALARVRQLSAHEVGHTLGFAHNFAASSNDRASVMDYPAPLVTVGSNGKLDFSKAYGVGVGAWDVFTTRWLYSDYSDGTDVDAKLGAMVKEAYASGLRFVGDREARSIGTANPYGSVWDNGEDAVDTLKDTMEVRRIALENFDRNVLLEGRDASAVRDVIVPIYLYHRYQTAAAAKLIGGVEFEYGVIGQGSNDMSIVPVTQQKVALSAVVDTLDPATLDLPDNIRALMIPTLGTYNIFGGGAERFSAMTNPLFDTVSAADSAATISLNALLNPARLSRLAEMSRTDPAALRPSDVYAAIERKIFARANTQRLVPIAHQLQARYVSELMELADSKSAALAVRNSATAQLVNLQSRLDGRIRLIRDPDAAHKLELKRRISAFLERGAPVASSQTEEPKIPPGSPIGGAESCWHCE